jgi:hypothetical protein
MGRRSGPASPRLPTVGERLVAALKELDDALASGVALQKRFKVRVGHPSPNT